MLASCSEDVSSRTYFSVYSQALPYTGGTVEATVYSNGDWAISDISDDMEVSPESGYGDTKLTITVPANDLLSTKSFHCTIKTTIGSSTYSGKTSVTVEAKPFVICQEDSMSVSSDGGKVWFSVNSNHPWSVAGITSSTGDIQGVEVNPSQWERNLTRVEVIVPANTSGAARTVFVKLALDDYPESIAVLTVCQPA